MSILKILDKAESNLKIRGFTGDQIAHAFIDAGYPVEVCGKRARVEFDLGKETQYNIPKKPKAQEEEPVQVDYKIKYGIHATTGELLPFYENTMPFNDYE